MDKEYVIRTFQTLRKQTELLCQPLAVEDYVIQSMEDVSPVKWHLAHTSWFFETFILQKYLSNYKPYQPHFIPLFNSYYQGLNQPFPRAKRGLLSRPTVAEIYAYRKYIEETISHLIEKKGNDCSLLNLIILGMNHEQQHQELLLMDIKYNFSMDPHFPAYQAKQIPKKNEEKSEFISNAGGLIEIGNPGEGFSFDNELPRHKKYLYPFKIASRLVNNREYLAFIEAGGYQKPEFWLADGWDCVIKNHWQAPLYWSLMDREWFVFTLNGLLPLNLAEPVSHISYYEADAFARYSGARLPSEEEWEHFVHSNSLTVHNGHFLETGVFHPNADSASIFGNLWIWTNSAYSPYPGFKPAAGIIGEYNGKFMANQMVLRGGSCITPKSHIRESYRNYFQAEKRWQFSGIRLAKEEK